MWPISRGIYRWVVFKFWIRISHSCLQNEGAPLWWKTNSTHISLLLFLFEWHLFCHPLECRAQLQSVAAGAAEPTLESEYRQPTAPDACAKVQMLLIVDNLCWRFEDYNDFLILCGCQWHRNFQSSDPQTSGPASKGDWFAARRDWSLWPKQSQGPTVSARPPSQPAWWQIRISCWVSHLQNSSWLWSSLCAQPSKVKWTLLPWTTKKNLLGQLKGLFAD